MTFSGAGHPRQEVSGSAPKRFDPSEAQCGTGGKTEDFHRTILKTYRKNMENHGKTWNIMEKKKHTRNMRF